MMRLFFAATLTAMTALASNAADWPQFLGPTRDNASSEKVAAWKDAPKVLWRQPVGDAHSSPVVANGVVYAFFKPKGKDADMLTAYKAETGEQLWQQSYDREKFTPAFGAGPRGTPVVDGGKVYTLGNTGVLACWDAKTGDVVWKVETLKDFKAKNLFFGVSTSPTLMGDYVVVMVGGKDAGIVAFEKATGKPAWHTSSDPASYASPLSLGDGGKQELIFLTGSHIRAVGADGKEHWAFPFKDRLNESSTTPVKAGDLIIGSSVTAGSVALSVKDNAPKEVWKDKKLTCYFSTPVLVEKHLYMINGVASLTKAAITLRCVEATTGKVAWEKPNIGKYHAAMIRTADNKLLMLDDAGNLLLLQPDPTGYKELAKAKVCGATWAHPALSNGIVFVRDDKELIAVKLGE